MGLINLIKLFTVLCIGCAMSIIIATLEFSSEKKLRSCDSNPGQLGEEASIVTTVLWLFLFTKLEQSALSNMY